MSEEKTQATTETVSESPAKETTQEALIEKLKAEQAYSKSQRQKKQDAQNRLAELESKLAKQGFLKFHASESDEEVSYIKLVPSGPVDCSDFKLPDWVHFDEQTRALRAHLSD